MLAAPSSLTVGELARRLGQPVHRIAYLIQSRHIRPVARAGIARVFTETDLNYLAAEIQRIDAEREVGRG